MRQILYPFAWAYRFGLEVRERLYQYGFRQSYHLEKPVVSVGNLTVGGTGKTPLVDVILKDFADKGLKVALLSRGYGRKTKGPRVVSKTDTADMVGDEPLWLKRRHPEVQVIVGESRKQASDLAEDVDVFVLDDGFQNREVKKHVEATLIDASRPKWHYNVLPAGRARLPWNTLSQSDVVIISKANLAPPDQVQNLRKEINKLGCIDVVESQLLVDGCRLFLENREISLDSIKDGVFLVSGIGNPGSFEELVRAHLPADVPIVEHVKKPDHSVYTVQQILRFQKRAKEKKASIVITTEKDAIKWQEVLGHSNHQGNGIPLATLSTKMTFQPELPEFYELARYSFR